MSSPNNSRAWWVVLTLTLLIAAPSVVAFYLPMSDLALHEGVIGLLLHLGEPNFAPSSLYRLNVGHPNQLFHVASFLIAKATGTRIAVKLVVAATQTMVILGAARLATKAGKSPLLGLLAVPMALGWFFYWGLITNMVGLAVLWCALPSLIESARSPSARNLGTTMAWFVLLFFAHETAFALGIIFFAMLATLSARSFGTLTRAAIPCVIGVALALVQLRYQEHLFAASVQRAPPQFPTVGHRAARLMDSLFGTHPLAIWWVQAFLVCTILALIVAPSFLGAERSVRRSVLITIALAAAVTGASYAATRLAVAGEELLVVRDLSFLLLVAVVVFAASRFGALQALRRAAQDAVARAQVRAAIQTRPHLLFGVVLLALFLVAPFNWNGATLLYERFFAPALLLLAIVLAPAQGLSRPASLTLCVLPVATLMIALPQFVEASRVARELEPIIARVRTGQAVAFAQLDPHSPYGRTFAGQTIGMRVIAERGGRASNQLTDSPISIVTMANDLHWDRVTNRLWHNGADLRLPHDLEMFSFVVVHVSDPSAQLVARVAFMPYAEHVTTSGEWMLFKSRADVRPIDLPELPAGSVPSARLTELCQQVADAHLRR